MCYLKIQCLRREEIFVLAVLLRSSQAVVHAERAKPFSTALQFFAMNCVLGLTEYLVFSIQFPLEWQV